MSTLQASPQPNRFKRLKYVLAATAIAVLFIWLAGPALSNRIIPTASHSDRTDIALIIHTGQAWLALPRPDGTCVAYSFAPQSSPTSIWQSAWDCVRPQPGALLKIELASGPSLASASRDLGAQEVWLIQAPQDKIFALVAKLDAHFAQNLSTLTNNTQFQSLQVAASEHYTGLGFNANQWAAARLGEVDTRVEGLGVLTRWSVEPFTP